jgi:fermentation-respiration switch protein FrsA (DUF1100 family)
MLDRAYLAEGMPTLIVWGRHDAIIPLGHGRLAHAALPGSRLEIFDEAGHFPHHVDPERFAHLVAEFVQSTAPARFDPDRWQRRLLEGRSAPEAPTGSDEDQFLEELTPRPVPSAN